MASLYERLGGKSAVEELVSDFWDVVFTDERITNEKVRARWAAADIPTLKMHVTNPVCMATGGRMSIRGGT